MTYSCRRPLALSDSVLCNEHHAKPCIALHHARISIGGLFERSCLDHRADVLQDAERKRVLLFNRSAGQSAVDWAASKNERESVQLDLISGHTHRDELEKQDDQRAWNFERLQYVEFAIDLGHPAKH